MLAQSISNGVHIDPKIKKTKYDKMPKMAFDSDQKTEYGTTRILQRNKDVDTPIRGGAARARTRKIRATPRGKKDSQSSPRGPNHQIMLQSVKRGRSGSKSGPPTASVVEPSPPQPPPTVTQQRKVKVTAKAPPRPKRPPQPHRVNVLSSSHYQNQHQIKPRPQPVPQSLPQQRPPTPVAVPDDAFKPTKILQRSLAMDSTATVVPSAAAIVARVPE